MSLSLPSTRFSTRIAPLAISKECALLLSICLLDTVSSAYFFHHNMAVEANPILLPFAEAGMLWFIAAKSLTFMPALIMAEWYRKVRPEFVLPLLRLATVIYAGVYALLVAKQFVG